MNLYDLIKTNELKPISPFIDGGITKLKKAEKESLKTALNTYEKNEREYIFGEEVITLDDEQFEIVTANPNQNIRILAGAGSGKTTTILCRVKYLVDNHITPNRILVLTFNKDASENLKTRIIKLFGFQINIDIYTIDAFCYMLYHKYEKAKAYVSISEFILIGRELMFKYGSEIASKYKYVFFDEFQDVNSKQFDILNQFVLNGCFLTVIGDDSQNIYQFRGTDNYFMINFDQIFKDTSTYTLTTNYRSTGYIINLANNCISYNQNQVKKVMKTNKKLGKMPRFVLSKTENEQIIYIINKIQEYIESGLNLDQIAILSRNSYHLKIMETELIKYDIPMVSCITDKIGENIKKILEPNKVAITTIHKSKGLEWSTVFLLGFAHQHFPSQLNNNIKNIEEERRLFYVGVTRAKTNLFLMATHSEVPVSIFIKENREFVKMVHNPKSSKPTIDIFDLKDENMIKQEYSVTDLVLLLNTENIDEMRKNGFIDSNLKPIEEELFSSNSLDLDVCQDKIEYLPEIKTGSYEPDFGEFVDRYITRDIMINSKSEFKDNDTLMILNATVLSNNEMEIYNKFKINCLNVDDIITEEEVLLNILNKVKNKKNKYAKVIKENTYPSIFMKNLIEAYKKCTTNVKSASILKDVYYISLGRNFNNDRRRLAYRDIFPSFEKMFKLLKTNMDKYVQSKKDNENTCKKTIYHKFKNVAVILGEIDLIDWSEETLIDIKCSEGDFKLEWYIQLLFYYTFLNPQEKSKIKYLGIANIMANKYYKFDIPKINFDSFINYIELMIKKDQSNFRVSNNPLNMKTLEYKFEPENLKTTVIKYENNKVKDKTIVIDTETSNFYNDILQISYVICDDTGKIIKTVDSYIKNRIPSNDSIKIHGITKDKINSAGIDFSLVIEELMKDLSQCKNIVGHNLQYDLTTIQNDIRTYGINVVNVNDKPKINIFEDLKIIDTLTLAKKKIKLEALYIELFGKGFSGAHNALNDVIATKDCYFKLITPS
jgi:superfamily I DNA/RNA helicase/DNA polymerase III epsilon subunit-like protein